MDNDAAPLVAAARPQPPRRRGVLLAMVGLLAVAAVGIATRLDGSDTRIAVSTAPLPDTGGGGSTTALPADTVGPVVTNRGDPGGATPDQVVPVQGTVVDPAAYGPQGTARVTLACGDTAETRKVTAFEVDTTATGATTLAWWEPAGRGHTLRVGDQFPAGARLAWAVTGVQLGPWPPDTVTDSCTVAVPAPTAPSRYTVPPTSVTVPVPGYDQAWTARATLACGASADTRRIMSFDATTNGAGTASLMAWDPATGAIVPLTVGAEFPVTHVLSWAIQGVLLGPWPVPQVTDDC